MIKKIIKQATGSGNLYSLLGNMVFAIFSFATFFIIVRTLDKAVFGQWVLFVTMTSLIDMFRLGLTGTGAIRLISRGKPQQRKAIGAASYKLGVIATFAVSILFFIAYYFTHKIFPDSYYLLVLMFYPLLAWSNLPFHQAQVLAQGKVNFKRVMKIKIINGALILLFVSGYSIFSAATIKGLILVYVAANLLSSCITVIAGWDELKHIGKADKKIIKSILQFGKYSTASSVGSSLLRSSDTIILSLAAFLGTEAIAIYAIPIKFVEAVEIPLRSFSATAFPRLSKAIKSGKGAFEMMLFRYTLWSTIILFPVVFILLSFPTFFLQLVGGAEYVDFLSLQKDILYIICIYILLLPLDRYSGVALFALDKPKLNFYKILIMLVANVIFDLIAVFVFHSLIYVALATLVFTLIGILTGWYMLLRETKTELKDFSLVFTERAVSSLILLKSWFYLEK